MISNRVLRIITIIAAGIAAAACAGLVHLQPRWLDLLASLGIGITTGLIVLFLFNRLPLDEGDDKKDK